MSEFLLVSSCLENALFNYNLYVPESDNQVKLYQFASGLEGMQYLQTRIVTGNLPTIAASFSLGQVSESGRIVSLALERRLSVFDDFIDHVPEEEYEFLENFTDQLVDDYDSDSASESNETEKLAS